MFRGGQPYTEFRAINAKHGKIRFEANPGEVILKANPMTMTDSNKIYLADGDGSMFVKGYHVDFGTLQVTGTLSLVPVGSFYKTNTSLTGIVTTSIVFAGIYRTSYAGAAIAVGAARCDTAGYLTLYLTNVTAATVDNGTLYVNYMILNPQTT